MYRFALRPAWLLSHLLVLALVVAMVNLGFWQLRRHDERQERNALVEARSGGDPVDAASLAGGDPDELRFRPVRVEGEPLGATVVIDNRSIDGRPGAWILAAVQPDGDGPAVMVNRGFVSYGEGLDIDAPAPPERFELVGTAEVDADRSCAGTTDDGGAVEYRYACVDLERIGDDLGLDLAPVEVRANEADTPELTAVPPPELDDGPHVSYAVQWFIFTAIAVFGYPLILRRVAQQRARDEAAAARLDEELRTLLDEAR